MIKNVKIIPPLDIIIKRTTLHPSLSTRITDLTFPEQLLSGLPLNSTPSEVFVTFSNNKPCYLALLTNVLDSVYHFSTCPIIAYGIDVDLDVDVNKHPRLIKRCLKKKIVDHQFILVKFML
jgi:hypothetical protein